MQRDTNLGKKFHQLISLFLLVFSSLYSEESPSQEGLDTDQYSSFINFETAPNAIVGGVVNIISGRYVETTTDYTSISANPIHIERSYSNASKRTGYLHGFCDLNVSGTLYIESKGKEWLVDVKDRGVNVAYYGEKGENLYLHKNLLKKNITNTTSPKLSGILNFKRRCFSSLNGHPIIYNGLDRSLFESKHCQGHYYLTRVLQRTGCSYKYQYHDWRVNGMQSYASDGQLIAGVKFIDHAEDPQTHLRTVTIAGDDGGQVTYQLSPYAAGKKYTLYSVTAVEKNFGPPVYYEYETRKKYAPELLTKKSYPDGRYLQISYAKSGRNKRKVIELQAPLGMDQSPETLYTFEHKRRRAHVRDAKGVLTTYFWNKQDRISKIDHHQMNGNLYRSERIQWGASGKLDDPTLLRSRYLIDSRGLVFMGKEYINDNWGNIVEERFYGNLSGQGKLCSSIKDKKFEKYVTQYTYYPNHLVKSETIGVEGCTFKQRIHYTYYDDSSLLKCKTISDPSRVRERYYYEYAPCGVPILEIIDDGTENEMSNLDNVTQRTLKRVVLSPRGLPVEEIHSYLDPETSFERLLSRVVIAYSKRGLILNKEYYDENDHYVFSESWKYNHYELVVEEVDRAGRTTSYDYDANGNCIYRGAPHLGCETHFTYDFCNRLIKEEERHDDGRVYVKAYAYDLKGNRISEVDPFGQETSYAYDEFDRMIFKTFPCIEDEQGNLVEGFECYYYNCLNHLRSKLDVHGKRTWINTNAYGKPYKIKHPDKIQERVIYYLDGSVKTTIDAQGTETHFAYDYKSRKTTEIKKSKKGDVLSTRQWTYDAFKLLEEVDPEGYVTTYTYDGAGRLIGQKKGSSETLIFYDAIGREKEKWEKCGVDSYRVTVLEYDLFDQVIEERIEDTSGGLFLKKEYAYDEWGNRTHETHYNQGIASTSVTQYNSSKQPIRSISPDGAETLFHYDEDINGHGQTVLSSTTIDSKGNVVILTYDSRGNIACEERKNTYAETVQKTDNLYDLRGKLIVKKENVIVSGEVVRVHRTAFKYDLQGRETTVIEAQGEPEQKITRRTYTAFGEVDEIEKPSGTILRHQYDALGRLSKLTSSDETIDYVYAYDSNNNIIDAKDRVVSRNTTRVYDSHGHVEEETLANGFSLGYTYDPLGRLTVLKLPDNSSIEYGYDAGYLREIRRGSYTHRDYYDISGRRQSSELVNQCGVVVYDYDQSLRPLSMKSRYLQTELAYDSIGNVEHVSYTDNRGSVPYSYQYDDLNQLTSDGAHEYTFDSLGNRVELDGVKNEHNALNQLIEQGDNQYTYDLNGNLIAHNDKTVAYDALDRMTEVVSGDARIRYTYDAFHRRLSKTHEELRDNVWEKVSTELFIYQADKEIGSSDDHHTINELRVMGVGVSGDVGAAVLMELQGKAYVPLHDYRGNVSTLVDADTGQVVESYRYTAFGVETVSALSEKPINPWRFSSKRVDLETGWSYFGARYYDAESGRWTTPDPMWFVDGTHLYCYVRNNPAKFIDPEGLWFEDAINFCIAIIVNTIKSGVEFASDNLDIRIDEYGNWQVNVSVKTPSFDRRSTMFEKKDQTGQGTQVSTINGIFTSRKDAVGINEIVSSMLPDCSTFFVHNASHGLWDLVECFVNYLGFKTRSVMLLHMQWNMLFANCSADDIIIHVCHSQGAIITRNALASYDPELRKRIHVIAVAPGAYIDQKTCGSVIHYVSKRDIVPWFDIVGRWKHRESIRILDPHEDASLFDHSFASPTYRKSMESRAQWIDQIYGKGRK